MGAQQFLNMQMKTTLRDVQRPYGIEQFMMPALMDLA